MKQHLFCFGLGYSATFLARQLMANGWGITGTCRSRDHQVELSRLGIEAHLFDRDRPLGNLPQLLSSVTHLLSSVPPDEIGDAVLDLHRAEIDAVSPRLAWIGYLSTTGVYGNRDGGWVDEMSELKPTGERGRRRARQGARGPCQAHHQARSDLQPHPCRRHRAGAGGVDGAAASGRGLQCVRR